MLVACAGTADLPVAEEALLTARAMGSRADLVADVGVAGLHRLLAHRRSLRGARVLVSDLDPAACERASPFVWFVVDYSGADAP